MCFEIETISISRITILNIQKFTILPQSPLHKSLMYFTTFWRQWKKEWDALALCYNPHRYLDPHEHHVTERDINEAEESSLSSFHSFEFFIFTACDPSAPPRAQALAVGSLSRVQAVEGALSP